MKKRMRIFSFMKWAVLAALLFAALPPFNTEVEAATSGFYNVTDPALTGILKDALLKRTPVTSDGSLRDMAPVIVVAHRGVVDKDHPENTMQSAVNVMNAGVEAMELDVYQSSDKVPYLMHDQTLKRMLNRPEYSDYYRWFRENAPLEQRTPMWSDIKNTPICTNVNDGYGKTTANNVCNDTNIYPVSLDEVLNELFNNSYQGFIFLDLRGTENVRDIAAEMARHYTSTSNEEFGAWVVNHVVLKFATTYFNGPADYSSKTRAHYQQKYGLTLSERDLSMLYILPVYFPNSATINNGGGATPWAINDYAAWKNWSESQGTLEGVLSPEVEIKSTGSILNYGADDLFTKTWKDGLGAGVYVPKKLCTFTPSAAIPKPSNYLGGDSGTWWEGGVCGPLAPTMNANECGSSGSTAITLGGGGCTDHRFLKEFWHDTSKFGFIITDTPVADINYLDQFPGQRPSDDIHRRRLGDTTYTVAQDGSGHYTTIAAALAALPDAGGLIQVAPGVYKEKLLISKSNVTLSGIGADASKVKITGNDYNKKINPATGQPYGTSGSATVTVTGSDFYATNLTIENTANYEAPGYEANEQAVALLSKGERAIYRAVMVLGGQDTLYVTNAKRAYFNNCYVEGYVDFIFGNGKAVFDNCTIKAKVHSDLRGQVTITAHSRESASEDSGFVFNNNKILFDDSYMDNVWLGRPWRAYSSVYFLNTKMGPQVKTPGWIEFIPAEYAPPGVTPTNNLPTSTYREYKTTYLNDNGIWAPFDISQRESISPNSNVELTDAEVSALLPPQYLVGNDNWHPYLITYGDRIWQDLPIPQLAVGAPGRPRINTMVGGNQNIQVSWSGMPANPQTTGYRIWAKQNDVIYGPVDLPPTATSGYVGGLTNGVPANIFVAGVNAVGVGEATIGSHTPVSDAPSAPSNIRFQLSGSNVNMSFDIKDEGSQPVFDGSVEHAGVYTKLYASKNDAYAGKSIAGIGGGFTTKNYTFNNLQPNTTYWVSLWAYNGKNSPTAITSFNTSSISSFQLCSSENQTCSFSGEKLVAYGANGWYSYKTATNSVSCTNSVFGDPISGTRKACYVK